MNNDLKERVFNFCLRITDDFLTLSSDLHIIHPEWGIRKLAGNLMEFGRGQISLINEPDKSDVDFILNYVSGLDFTLEKVALFSAYSAGCIWGLVKSKQLDESELIDAIQYAKDYAYNEFQPGADPDGREGNGR